MRPIGGQKINFDQLRKANIARQKQAYQKCAGWSIAEWGCALAGEVGEACNLIKKLRLGRDIKVEEIGKELADVVIYVDLLAEELDIDLAQAVRDKFNEVSERVGSKVAL